MKVIVIGAYGHIGTYLIPRLVKEGYEVIAISRGLSQPYHQHHAWKQVQHISMDRKKDPLFAKKIADMHPDIVIDLINFHLNDTKQIVAALKSIPFTQYIFCSSIWAHGRSKHLPADPNDEKFPLDDYGIQKYQSELYLKQEFQNNGFPATIIMPGQISGPGWLIINPYGNTNTDVIEKVAHGKTIYLPNWGMETLHHVHADDVAQMFIKAIQHKDQVLGQSFHAVSDHSITLYGYASLLYEFFHQKEDIQFLPWNQWCSYVNRQDEIDHTYYHIARSGYYSIENAKKLMDYSPQYSIEDTIRICMESYIKKGFISLP